MIRIWVAEGNELKVVFARF
ncbi:Bgt-51866 [Blumeria graminis f. sp. tritici]|uniref:Bgt-51866 n=1 Tax=Blumeria graminis f. sp. tritici TaxID=62690 RepID=A0A9X9L884_BLUGR|nr:Bgt-51866 [Blumeria graminis f. sp. tritici]